MIKVFVLVLLSAQRMKTFFSQLCCLFILKAVNHPADSSDLQ